MRLMLLTLLVVGQLPLPLPLPEPIPPAPPVAVAEVDFTGPARERPAHAEWPPVEVDVIDVNCYSYFYPDQAIQLIFWNELPKGDQLCMGWVMFNASNERWKPVFLTIEDDYFVARFEDGDDDPFAIKSKVLHITSTDGDPTMGLRPLWLWRR